MKVLFIQKMAGMAGSELYFIKIMPELRARGIECEFLCVYDHENKQVASTFINTLSATGVLVHELGIGSAASPAILKHIHQMVKERNIDILHSNLIHADLWCAMVKLLYNRKLPVVSMKHGYDEKYQAKFGLNPEHRKLDAFYFVSKFAGKIADRTVTISSGLANFLGKAGIIDQKKLQVIRYGFDFSSVTYDTSGREYRYSNNQLVIIGRLIPVKGHRFVFGIMKDLIARFPDIMLVLVGTGPSEQELKQQVEQLGIAGHVRFEGFQRNIHDYLRHSEIAVIPSTAEGFCAVILEAWHNLKPVITFDVPAPNEIIRNNETGYLIKPFDTEELKEKITYLLEHPEERDRLGKEGYKSLQEDYSLTGMVDSTIKLYNTLLTK